MNTLRELRIKKDLSIPEAAKKIGISTSLLQMMEIGERKPSYETMKKVSDFYHKTVDYIFFAKN